MELGIAPYSFNAKNPSEVEKPAVLENTFLVKWRLLPHELVCFPPRKSTKHDGLGDQVRKFRKDYNKRLL